MLKRVSSLLVAVSTLFLLTALSFSDDRIPTRVIVRVVSKDAKVIGSGVGGALVRIKDLDTGEILAQGKQEGGTGDTDRIMVQSRQRGATVYGTPDAASFQAEIHLSKPTQIEIYTEAPLGYPQATQKGTKTVTLIPGKHLLEEGVIVELDGLIVNVSQPVPGKELRSGQEVQVKAEVRML